MKHSNRLSVDGQSGVVGSVDDGEFGGVVASSAGDVSHGSASASKAGFNRMFSEGPPEGLLASAAAVKAHLGQLMTFRRTQPSPLPSQPGDLEEGSDLSR